MAPYTKSVRFGEDDFDPLTAFAFGDAIVNHHDVYTANDGVEQFHSVPAYRVKLISGLPVLRGLQRRELYRAFHNISLHRDAPVSPWGS